MTYEDYTNNILTAPADYHDYVIDRITSYRLHKMACYSGARAIRYDNPLGCKIQASGGRTEADTVIDLLDEEYCLQTVRCRYWAAESLLRAIMDYAGLSDKDKQIITYRYLTYPALSYASIARRMGYTSESGARMAHNRAVAHLVDFIASSNYF